MSDEPEVSPLRLKRPGAGGPPSPAPTPVAPPTPPASDAPLAPLMPLLGSPGGLPPLPASAADLHDPTAPERNRRRPSLASDEAASSPPALSVPQFTDFPPPPPAVPFPVIPPPPRAADVPPAAPAAAPVFKLKMSTRPSSTTPPEMIGGGEPSTPLEEPGSGGPLLPLPGIGTMAGGAPLPPLFSIPPPPSFTMGAVSVGEPTMPPRGPVHLRAEGPAEALDPSKLPPPLPPLPARAAKAAVGKSSSKRGLLLGLLLLLVVGAGAYLYFFKYAASQEAAGVVRQKLDQASRAADNAMNDAKQALANARVKEQARVDAIGEGKEPPSTRAVGGVTPGELQVKLQDKNNAPPAVPSPAPAAAASSVTAYAGGTTTDAAPQPTPQASARFLRYAEGLRVSGVFQGSPARALIDGRLVRQGDMVEPTLKIKFADIDTGTKQLILEDVNGVQVRVKY